MTRRGARFALMRMVRAKQPKIIMNNRLFRNPEAGWSGMGTAGFSRDWIRNTATSLHPSNTFRPRACRGGLETCMTMNTTWGFNEHDHAWKSDATLLRNLIDIASKGGN